MLDSQANDVTFKSNSDKDESFESPCDFTKNTRKIQNLFEALIETPDRIAEIAKEMTIVLYQFKDEDFSDLDLVSAHPCISFFALYLVNALTFPSKNSDWRKMLELAALVDAHEMKIGSDVCQRVLTELVEFAANDQRSFVRERTCFLIKELLQIEAEAKLAESSIDDESDDLIGEKDVEKSPDSFDDEDIIDFAEVPKSVRISAKVSNVSLRSMQWATLLEKLRRDKNCNVRSSAVKALAFVPDVRVFVDENGTTKSPDKMALDHLFDMDPVVRTSAIDSLTFSSRETIDRCIDALETENDMQVRVHVLKKLETLELSDLLPKQRDRLMCILFGNDNFSEKWCCNILLKWLYEIAETNDCDFEHLQPSLIFDLIDPIANKQLAERIFSLAASVCERETIGSKGTFDWMVFIRNKHIVKLQENPDSSLSQRDLMKETVMQRIGGCEIFIGHELPPFSAVFKEFPELGQRLFVYRNLIHYFQKQITTEDPTSVGLRFLPPLSDLARAVEICVLSLSRENFDDVMKEEDEALMEFVILEMCALMRQVDHSDSLERYAWRKTLMTIIKECSFIQDRDSLAAILQDIVDHTSDSKDEALRVVDDIAYTIHEMLSVVYDVNQEQPSQDEANLKMVPRCSLLLEALLRNASIDRYSGVLKGLIFRLVELATAVDETRSVGCRMIAIASCIDEEILCSHGHILSVLPSEIANEPEMIITCLEGIAEMIGVHGVQKVSAAFFADLDPKPQDDQLTKEHLILLKTTKLMQVYENAMMDENKLVQESAVENSLRILVQTHEKWSLILGRCLLLAFSIGTSPKIRTMIDSFVQNEITWDIEKKGFMAASLLQAIFVREKTSRMRTNLNSLLVFGLNVIRRRDERNYDKVDGKAEKADLIAEQALTYGLLDHCFSHPDSDLCLTICTILVGCLPTQKYRETLAQIKVLNPLLETIRKTLNRLAVNGQNAAVKMLTRLQSRLYKHFDKEIGESSSMTSQNSLKSIESSIRTKETVTIFPIRKERKAPKRSSPIVMNSPTKVSKKEPILQTRTQYSLMEEATCFEDSHSITKKSASVYEFGEDGEEDLFNW